MNKTVLQWLLEHPGWHYATDLVEAGVCSRLSIYVALGNLEETGFVEMRHVPSEYEGALPRTQYRATGKLLPDDGLGDELPAKA